MLKGGLKAVKKAGSNAKNKAQKGLQSARGTGGSGGRSRLDEEERFALLLFFDLHACKFLATSLIVRNLPTCLLSFRVCLLFSNQTSFLQKSSPNSHFPFSISRRFLLRLSFCFSPITTPLLVPHLI